MKFCKSCGQEKPKDDKFFYKQKNGYFASICRECRRIGQKKYNTIWRDKHPNSHRMEKQRIGQQRWRLKNKFGMTLEQFEEMAAAQHGVCKICGEPPSGRYIVLCVDHDHDTGAIRGLLCNRFNTSLGWFEPKKEAVMKYLETSNG